MFRRGSEHLIARKNAHYAKGNPSLPRRGIAFARASQRATHARFSSGVIARQAPISCNVRRQPTHNPRTRSTVQTLMHGDVTGVSFAEPPGICVGEKSGMISRSKACGRDWQGARRLS